MSNGANYTIVITEKGGKPRAESFEQSEITIGRVQGNDIVLPKGNISKRHTRIVLRDGKFIIVDLKSTNGTFVNGKRISSPQILKDSDKINIGDFILQLEMKGDEAGGYDDDDARPNGNGRAANGAPGGVHDEADDVAPADDLKPIPPMPAPARAPVHHSVAADMPVAAPEPKKKPSAALPPALSVVPANAVPEEQPQATRSVKGAGLSGPRPRPVAPPRQEQARPAPLAADLPPTVALQARAAVFAAVSKALGADAEILPDDDASIERARAEAEKRVTVISKKLQGVDTSSWAQEIALELCGLGPLTQLLEDPAVVEVFINGPHQVLVRRGQDASSLGIPLGSAPGYFSSEEAVALVIRRVMHAAGLKFDAEHPIAEARMVDDARVNAVHHAVAVRGPLVTISRTNTRTASLAELAHEQVLSEKMAEFLRLCVRSRQNVVVCGGPGAGAGVLISALAAEIPADERVVVVEQVARLRLPQPHVVTLEPRPLRGGPSAATMRDLVANAVRMRPGRLVVHEVNGAEALELSMAMAGRQDGTLFTTYAGTARDCLDRLETMVRMAGLDVQAKVVREQIASSVHVVVALTRFADGSSRVTQIAEVTGVEVDLVTTQDIFTFKRERFDENGAVQGRFMATGIQPRFTEELVRRGSAVNPALFRD